MLPMPCRFMLLILCALTSRYSADLKANESPKLLFDNLFGVQLKQVLSTPETSDDLELAQLILTVVEESQVDIKPSDNAKDRRGDKFLFAYFCREAMKLARYDAQGGPILDKARIYQAQLMTTDLNPKIENLSSQITQTKLQLTSAPSIAEKRVIAYALIELCLEKAKLYESIDDQRHENTAFLMALKTARSLQLTNLASLEDRYKQMKSRHQSEAKIRRFKKDLEKDPSDEKAARHLFYHYVLDRNQPEKAKPLLDAIGDERLKEVSELLFKDNLSSEDKFELAQWYMHSAKNSSVQVRAQVYQAAYELMQPYKKDNPKQISVRMMESQLNRLLALYSEKQTGKEPEATDSAQESLQSSEKEVNTPQNSNYTSLLSGLILLHDFEVKGSAGNFQNPMNNVMKIDSKSKLLYAQPTQAIKQIEGRYGKGVRLKSDQYLLINEGLIDLKQPSTLAIWIKMIGGAGILSQGNQYYMNYNLQLKDIRWQCTTFWRHQFQPTPIVNTWNHLLLINKGDSRKLLVNGVIISTKSKFDKATKGYDPQEIVIGRGRKNYQFIGALDELAIWDRPLSEKEIDALWEIASRTSYINELVQNAKRNVGDTLKFNERKLKRMQIRKLRR